MKTVVVIMVIIFALCVGVSMGGEKNVPQEGKRLAVNKVVASSKMIDYDSDYDEVVTKQNTAKIAERHSKKSQRDSTIEINTEVIQ